MTQRRLTRRTFLRGLGGVAVSLPFLGMGLPGSEAFGQASGDGPKIPKRFIFITHPNGVISEAWFPPAVGREEDFQLQAVHQPLAAFRDKLTLFHGVHLSCSSVGPGEPHQTGMGGLLTGRPLQEGTFIGGDGSRAGWGDGISLDQYLAQKIGHDTPFGSLELGVRADTHAGSEVRSRLAYAGPGQPLPPLNDPFEVYQRLFSDFMTDDAAVRQLRERRASVLDSVMDQFGAVMRRAGAEDRQRLDQHLTLIRDLERRLQSGARGSEGCFKPNSPEQIEPDNEMTMPQIAQAHADLLIVAMACDLTRVATIQFSNAKNHIRFPWVDSLGDGHALSHAGPSNTDAMAQWIRRDVWHAEQIGYLMTRMSTIMEADGSSMLDNTLIVWCSEIARGNTHSHRDMPFLMAGSMGGHFKTGRYVRYNDKPHNDLLVSILHAFGVEDESFGDARFCNGPLTGLTA